MSDERINLVHLGLTPQEYRELLEALRLALEYIEENYENDCDNAMADPTDVVDYLRNAQEILNG